MRRYSFALLALALSIATAAAAAVSPQGILLGTEESGWTVSPAGDFRMEVQVVGGDFHRIVADLRVIGPGGAEQRLRGIEGTAFLVADAGRVVVLTHDHPKHIPDRIEVFDLTGRRTIDERVFAVSDAVLASDGRGLACRTREGVLLLDLSTGGKRLHPMLDPFAAGSAELLAGALPGENMLRVYEQGEPVSVHAVAGRPRRLHLGAKGGELLVLTSEQLLRFDLITARRGVLHRAAGGEELRDLAVDELGIRVGLRVATLERTQGAELLVDRQGAVIERFEGESLDLGAAGDRTHGPIPWPLAPDAQQPVGNTYGEFQDYGSSYLHPGVDVMGDPDQPCYAVAGGVVKAVITTSGQWHWRVAIGQPGGGTSEGYLYAHLSESSIAVNVGDPIVAGQYLGDLVPWPSYGFTHCHFARIEDSGTLWYGDWLCVDNPHIDFANQADPEAPVFEPAVGGDLLAFCANETSSYQNPWELHGAVDIVAHVGDRILTTWVCAVQELRYTIYRVGFPGFPLVDDKLAVNFDMALDTYQGGPIDPFLVDLLYKTDGTCFTEGDYNGREFYHILTNSDGDEIYETSDLLEAWDTTNLGDGDYVIRVSAADAFGNVSVDSMVVTTANGNPTAVDVPLGGSARLSFHPNPTRAGGTVVWAAAPGTKRTDIAVFDVGGRLVRTLGAELGESGSLGWDGKDAGGRELPSGVYLLRRSDARGGETTKVQLIR